ncbi:MAG TPA: AAA family ATPase [Chloroflexi bacterium]|nr:AAA family ATPase [Chloroflexota bacterium]
MRQILEYQADQIEMVLHSHRTPARVTGGTVTPRWVRYQVTPAIGARINAISKLSEEIALRLGVGNVRITRQGGRIHIEVPRQDAQAVRLLPLLNRLPETPRQSAVLGLDEGGVPLLLRLPSPDVAHVLVAGTTGSGKTALARSMALSLAVNNRLGEIQLVMIDPKGGGFGPLIGLPHLLRPVVREIHQAVFLLGDLVEEMVRRDRDGISEPRVVVFIDEVADLLDQGGNAMGRLLTRLTQRGRSAGIHIVACTQKPLAASIGSLTKSNFPVRLVGSVASPDDAKVAAGIGGTGAEKLLGRGDFLLVAKGRVTRFQAAFVNGVEMRRVVEKMNEGARRSRRWLAEETPIALAATGTDGGRPVLPGGGNTPARKSGVRSRLRALFGTQLRLIK